jgi:acetyl-CoA carboxylase biotin carboxylase subunit
MGIRTVAAYSAADEESEVVRFADDAVRIGPAAARRSYLYSPAIIEAALKSGADAIHPGYGFLSEDPDFAEICAANDLTFIGPSADVMGRLGDKAATRLAMADAGLPVLPGSDGPVANATAARQVAGDIGYPLIIKAVAGGGGRGMTMVRKPDDFDDAYRDTRSAAQALFGDGRVYIERFVRDAKHVEVQVLRDSSGQSIHLGERDCSVQRRQQKLLEETPAPALGEAARKRICQAAVTGASASGLTGAGTFEFVTASDDFYFIEINGRIQVEHPVTEMVTGIDIIKEQISIAAGLPLEVTQAGIRFRGAAIECRVNAEDPQRGFTPTPGTLTEFRPPGGPFTRVDSCGRPGWTVTPDYDSLLGKVITWGPDRDSAIERMDRALYEFLVTGRGVSTTIAFLRDVIRHQEFRQGRHTTSLVAGMCG